MDGVTERRTGSLTDEQVQDSLAARLARVRDRVDAAARRAGRSSDEITLVGACKTVPVEVILQAAQLGLRDFGENYVQEAAAKRAQVTSWPTEIRWHLIGHLQSNKVKAALDLFDIIQTVDSLRIGGQISRRAGERRVPVLLEVALGDAPERTGFRPEELDGAVASLEALPGLAIEGLMVVPPLGLSADETRRIFRHLRGLQEGLRRRFPALALRHLSMGMTEDYELAIEEGATIVRVGRAIFGERPRK